MGQRARVGHDPARRDSAMAQRPDESFGPMLAFGLVLDIGQRPGDTLIGVIHGLDR